MIVNSSGNRDDTRRTTRTDPIQGRQLRLTLDLGLQRAAHKAIGRAIEAAHGNGNPADAGAYVAMDPRDGEVLALGSYPSFDANLFAKPIDQETYDELNSRGERRAAVQPRDLRRLSDRLDVQADHRVRGGRQGAHHAEHAAGRQRRVRVRRAPVQERRRRASSGRWRCPRALQVSSDVFFYQLGARANERGAVIQEWARQLSFGKPTGIDLPGEYGGLVPDRKWRDGLYDEYQQCRRRPRSPTSHQEALFACGGIDRAWSGGDNVNLSVGQGDLQATPLQLATAYAAIANGGRVVTPHLGKQVEDGAGRQLEEIRKPAQRRADFPPEALAAVREGLRAAAMESGGTSADVFAGFPHTVYGKTGTAERGLSPDQSWYACYVDDPVKPIVVVVTVEKGGFGAESAAPAARLILSKWFGVKDSEFRVGESATR